MRVISLLPKPPNSCIQLRATLEIGKLPCHVSKNGQCMFEVRVPFLPRDLCMCYVLCAIIQERISLCGHATPRHAMRRLLRSRSPKNKRQRKTTDNLRENSSLHDAIYPLGNQETRKSKHEQARGDTPKPGKISLVLLTGNPDVHAPKARDDVHG